MADFVERFFEIEGGYKNWTTSRDKVVYGLIQQKYSVRTPESFLKSKCKSSVIRYGAISSSKIVSNNLEMTGIKVMPL